MGINVSIVAGQNKAASSVKASGSVQHVITPAERKAFNLSDNQLKNAIKAYFKKAPNDAFLRSPTPWGDLYKTYGWPQVQLVLAVQSAEILAITSEPVIVKSQEFVNNSSRTANFNVAISESVNNTTSSSWTVGNSLAIGQKFSYGVSFLGADGKGETSMSYTHSWGEGGSESKSITVGSTSGLTVQLGPGEAVIAELSASRGVMKVRIVYNAYLVGRTAVNYYPPYKGHHFYALSINDVMVSGRIPNSIKSTENIEVGYYSNSRIELKDIITKKVKEVFRMADLPGAVLK